MMAKKLCIFFFVVLCIATSYAADDDKPKATPRIVNGTVVDQISEVPWQGSLHVIMTQAEPTSAVLQQICGAVLVSYKWSMTAAHCTNGQKAETLLVRFGSTQLFVGGIINQINRIVQHDQFDPFTMDYDFALLEMANIVTTTDKIMPVLLPGMYDQFAVNTTAYVSGWGTTRNSSESQVYLRGVNLPLFNQTRCTEIYAGVNDITARMICAGYEEGGRDACAGDSGSPLVIRIPIGTITLAKLVGLVSWGNGCAEPHYPGVYADVRSVRDWITRIAAV